MGKEKYTCEKCIFCYCDNRSHIYHRPPMYFCKKRGSFFSRNYQIGENTRISKEMECCEHFKKKK